ncbi:hypothetical protein ACJX0J_006076, partial [Zea mays]
EQMLIHLELSETCLVLLLPTAILVSPHVPYLCHFKIENVIEKYSQTSHKKGEPMVTTTDILLYNSDYPLGLVWSEGLKGILVFAEKIYLEIKTKRLL